MAKKKRMNLILTSGGSVTIRDPQDGTEGLLPNFQATGVFNPYGLYLRAQIRTTNSPIPSAGSPVSELKEDAAFAKTADGNFTIGNFTDIDPPHGALEEEAYFLHVWAYQNGASTAHLDHHAIAIRIGTATFVAAAKDNKKKK